MRMPVAIGTLLSVGALLLTPMGVCAASGEGRVIEPHGRYCFRIGSGWADGGYDANSDTVTIRHQITRAKLTYGDSCWLMKNMAEAEASEIEALLFGLGPRISFVTFEGRYGPGGLALYERRGEAGTDADELGSPFFGCVNIESGWLIAEGTVSSADVPELQRILQEARIDCERFDAIVPSN